MPGNADTESGAAVVRCLRAYLGLTPQQTADELGMSPRALQRFESGAVRVPRGVVLDMLDLADEMEGNAEAYARMLEVRLSGLTRLEERAVGQALRENPELRVIP